MILLFLVTGALGSGQSFDAEIYPPGRFHWFQYFSPLTSLSAELSEGLHTLLRPAELHYMFGSPDPATVDRSQYMLVALHDVTHQERLRAKRSGEQEPDAAFKLDMFGREYNMR